MDSEKVRCFMKLAGQEVPEKIEERDEKTRTLGAQLLLSEVLEYIIRGLGVVPEVNGVRIEHPESLTYSAVAPVDKKEMLDGLADVAYTMYWNECAFGLPLERAFDLVSDNNLEKFVRLDSWAAGEGALPAEKWDCGQGASWPAEVVSVTVVLVEGTYYAVGKDKNGKVRKPGSYRGVDLSALLVA